MDVAVIGAGRVGTAMAVLLRRAGHRIVAVSGTDATRERAERHLPDVPAVSNREAAREATLVLIGTPDATIEPVAGELARAGALREGVAVAHFSGATGLDALEAARAVGATTMSIHPLQTCPDVEASIARIPGSAFAVTGLTEEGYALGERLARDVGGRPFRLDDAMKPLYHAAAVLASNDLVVLASLAESMAAAAGVPDPPAAFMPLQRATLDNIEVFGPAGALTGPVVRGDAATVERNLEAVHRHIPEAMPVYVALADVALDLAERSGRLGPEARAAVGEVLDRWR